MVDYPGSGYMDFEYPDEWFENDEEVFDFDGHERIDYPTYAEILRPHNKGLTE